jgi:hypothetical protein
MDYISNLYIQCQYNAYTSISDRYATAYIQQTSYLQVKIPQNRATIPSIGTFPA